jgi:hypothetical protein
MAGYGKLLIGIGAMLVIAGTLLWLFGKTGGRFLPGDIVVERKNVHF